MKPDLKPLSVILLLVGLSVPVDGCPPRCKCDWKTKHVSCTGVELVPLFHLSLQEVWLVRTKLAYIPQNAFASLPNISHIYISDDSALRSLERNSFYNLSSVMHIELHSIKTLSYIHPEAFKELPNLKYLGITNTGLTSFPVLQYVQSRQEDFILEIVENVFLRVIPANSFTGVSENALTVMLNGNGLTEIQDYAFNGSQLEEVYLHRNMDLEHIAEYAFYGVIHGPTHLDLSETKVHSLPSIGMSSIEILQVRKTWALKALPPFSAFLHLQSAYMTFASHCCGLKMLKRWRREEHFCNQTRAAVTQLQESFTVLGNNLPNHLKNNFQTPTYHRNNPGIWGLDKKAKDEGLFDVDLSSEALGEELDFALCDDLHQDTGPLCTPLPDALNPCEDVMSQGFLRVLVWVVSLLAISANLLVLFILLTSQQKLSVTRFLLGHLAFADGCMGMYLLLIATVDYYTHSNYYHYAISWQTGSGCQMAGILSLFASELSVYTLTAISFQRWHAIFNAMRPDRQMRLRHAAVLMLIGWLLCGTVAFLPVLGVNTYQRVSICLPMDSETVVAQFYIVSVLILNIMAFIVVSLCYLHIYCMVHNPQHDSSRCDTSMAKRMAVLIFTNFLCLAPICFYGLVAVFHQPLMTITDSKVLLVLFYPLNSCAHPFFYAILTKAFHRDILMLFSRMGLCQKQAYHSRSQFLCITPHVYRETLPGRTASQQHQNT
ncbi:thyrotropin receptor-like isoform X1 [Poecilia reticulata]|uniref:thyrotropin receptor-like isoform X1 n=1 Tax=Poecilia reticulata TaxID=8081 RepID=UPI0004A2960A|nr:PREDICTED: thyrotropin receptor-like isoform X1 [Poecilia reticulata]